MADAITLLLYGCYNCHNHVARHDDIVSKDYLAGGGGRGRGFLFYHVKNVVEGPKEDRQLISGLYMVADVSCSDCGEVLGWRYKKAYNAAQKYKETKTVLAKFKIVKDNW